MDRKQVALTIRRIMKSIPYPKEVSVHSVREWKFPIGDTYHIHRPAEVMMVIYFKRDPIGVFDYFVEGKAIKINIIQGVKIEGGKEVPRLEKPWSKIMLDSFIFATTPFDKEGYSIKYNESLVVEIGGWIKSRALFQKELELTKAKVKDNRGLLQKVKNKKDIEEEINDLEYQASMHEKRINQYNNLLRLYCSIRKNYFDDRTYVLSHNKPATRRIVSNFEEHLNKSPVFKENIKHLIEKPIRKKPTFKPRGIRL